MENFINDNKVLIQKYADDFSIPVELARIVARRYPEYDDAKSFLYPDVNNLYNPEKIPDIELAGDEIIKAVNQGEGILIYCHDDPDGYTSGALLYKTLSDLHRGDKGPIYIYPIVREKDGYVLNPEVLKSYQEKGVKLVITVDFGISNKENFHIAKEQGLRLIICDHHETNLTEFPIPAVDPKRMDSKYPFRELAGVGVSFKLCQLMYQKAFGLNQREFYNLKKEFFAITMVGTIADRVSVISENRIFCHEGLKSINKLNRPWVNFFKKNGDFSFARINSEIIPAFVSAASLDPNLGVRLFVSDNEHEVAEIIEKLKIINENRKQEIDDIFQEAISATKTFPKIVISVIPLSKLQYLGAVSSRLRDYFQRTAVTIAIRDDKCFGELRASGINLYEMLYHLRALLLDFGGHKRAAGFSMRQENLDNFIEQANNYTQKCVIENCLVVNRPEALLDKSQIYLLAPLAPFSDGNPAPVLTDGTDVYTIDNKFNIIERGIWQT